MTRPIRDYVSTDYGQMHVRISKPAQDLNKPLLCLHMMPQSGRYFEEFMHLASQDRIVIAPDYHGYGESDPPPADVDVTIADYARTTWQCLDQLGVSRIDILGHHTGSKVAIEMVQQRRDRVFSIVLMSASVNLPDTISSTDSTYSPIVLDRKGSWLSDWWQQLQGYYGKDFPVEDIFAQYVESIKAGGSFHRGFLAAHRYGGEFSTALQSLDHPITVINPNDDLFETTQKAMKFVRNGKLINKPDWATGFLNSNADEVTQAVVAALSEMSAHSIAQ